MRLCLTFLFFFAGFACWTWSAPAETTPASLTYYVAPEGRDAWTGQLSRPTPDGTDGPWASLAPLARLAEGSRLASQATVEVIVQPGTYQLASPFNLKGNPSFPKRLVIRAADSAPAIPPAGLRPATSDRSPPAETVSHQAGSGEATRGQSTTPQTAQAEATPPGAPSVQAGSGEGQVLLSGGRLVTAWQPAQEIKDLPQQLPPESTPHVFVADLKAMGIQDFGSAGGRGIQLFYRDAPMTLARWPNQGFTQIVDVLNEQPVDVRGTRGDKVGKFVYADERQDRWRFEKDPWVHGYWFWDWSDQRHAVATIDPEKNVLAVKPPYHSYGYRKGQWYYGYNLLCELDHPGEWYLDRETGRLYFWPPDSPQTAAQLAAGRPVVSTLESLIRVSGAHDVEISGLTLAHTRGTAITFTDCENCVVAKCRLHLVDGSGVTIDGGKHCAVQASELFNLGEGGVSASGGDRVSLTSSNHVIRENHIHHYGRIHPMYRAGVSISGVGQQVIQNHIHHAPHQAVGFSGNNHLIAYNEIDHVCLESNDAGAIYAGRDWTMRGTKIIGNYFHEITGFEDRGCMGVYLDDMFCGTSITHNVFYRVTRAAFIGGGRDNLVENNLFIECRPAVHVDARAMGWASYHVATTMTERLNAVPYQSALWKSLYPPLATILQDEPAAPKGNIIRCNVCVGGTWENIEPKARPYIRMEKNLVLPWQAADEVFVNPANQDWQFKPGNRIEKELPEFEPIPWHQIGPKPRGRAGYSRLVRPLVVWVAWETPSGQVLASSPSPESIKKWEPVITRFEEQDRRNPPPKDAILFVGSSSIVRWDVAKSFPQWTTLNRGFGGSQIHEVTYFADRIVIPYHPRLIVFYAGDNDIAAGAMPEEILTRFRQFVDHVRKAGLDAPIICIGIKPSIKRWHLIKSIRKANALIQEYCRDNPAQRVVFLDVEAAMLGPDGKPQPDLFVEDGLHLSEKGYELWTKLLQPVAESQLKMHPQAGSGEPKTGR